MGFSVGEFTHFDCGDIKYETYAGVVAILQEEAVLNNWKIGRASCRERV